MHKLRELPKFRYVHQELDTVKCIYCGDYLEVPKPSSFVADKNYLHMNWNFRLIFDRPPNRPVYIYAQYATIYRDKAPTSPEMIFHHFVCMPCVANQLRHSNCIVLASESGIWTDDTGGKPLTEDELRHLQDRRLL